MRIAGTFAADELRRRQSVHDRHLNVQKDDVERTRLERFDGLKSVADRMYLRIQSFERAHDDRALNGVVLGDEDSGCAGNCLQRCGRCVSHRLQDPQRRGGDGLAERFVKIVGVNGFTQQDGFAGQRAVRVAVRAEQNGGHVG